MGDPASIELADSHLVFAWGEILESEHPSILLFGKDCECIVFVTGGDDALEEMTADCFGGRLLDNARESDHTAECRFRIACKGVLPSTNLRCVNCRSAGICVLDDDASL